MKWASSFLFYLEYLKLKLGLGWEIVEKWVGGLAVQCWGGGRGPFFFLHSNGFFFFFFFAVATAPPSHYVAPPLLITY